MLSKKKTGKKEIKIKPQTKAQKDKAEQVFNKIMAGHGRLEESISKVRNQRIYLPPDAPRENTISGSPEVSVTKNENSFEFE
ncbi:MAG: hypothetical protein HQ509_00620 [Candidatus Marinimicrobia bacterium]|nr:hypothetical protein [Candidatus Neomarinimicrobiota bacterium]